MTHSIFGSLALTRVPAPAHPCGREPSSLKLVSILPVSDPSVAARHAAPLPASPPSAARPTWSASTDLALIAILEAPLHAGETVALGFARKEAELRHVLASLSIFESRALKTRLSCPKDGDPLPKAFMRLTAERRERLINFIADARRRESLASRHGGGR